MKTKMELCVPDSIDGCNEHRCIHRCWLIPSPAVRLPGSQTQVDMSRYIWIRGVRPPLPLALAHTELSFWSVLTLFPCAPGLTSIFTPLSSLYPPPLKASSSLISTIWFHESNLTPRLFGLVSLPWQLTHIECLLGAKNFTCNTYLYHKGQYYHLHFTDKETESFMCEKGELEC